MELLKVSDFALQSYRSFVKGNFNLSSNEVAKKLTRNILLGVRIGEIDRQTWYAYGQLRILVQGDTITCVMNHRDVVDGWELDYFKLAILDSVLGITR